MSRKRIAIVVACCGLAAAPLHAQNAAEPATPPAPAPAQNESNTVGPRELRDFNLGGTVTRPAEPAPAPAAEPASSAPVPAASAPRREAPTAAAADTRPAPTPQPRTNAPQPSTTEARPDPLAQAPATGFTPVQPDAASLPASGVTTPLSPTEAPAPAWPWLVALAAVLGAGGWWWMKRRTQPALAGMPFQTAEPAAQPAPRPAPQPAPRAPAPAPAPKPAPPKPVVDGGGIVARTLAPKIALEFTPLRVDTDGNGAAAVNYELAIVNTGSAPARDVLIEHLLVNAGPDQDRQVGAFFSSPAGRGDRVPMIPPMDRIKVRSRVALPADQLRAVEVEGRKLLVPLVAFNALYRGPSGEQQDSASFLVGRARPDGGKMGPMPLDRGAMAWTGLGARVHSTGLNR